MSVERKPHRSSPHFSQFLDVSSNQGPCWLLHLNQSYVARDWRREEAGRGLSAIFRTSELIESQFFARWCTEFSRLGRTAEKKRKLQTDFWIKLFLLCLLSIEPKRVVDLTWKMLPFEMCLSKLDFETFHFRAFEFELFDFQRVVDFEKHALITSSWPSKFDFENLNENWIWKVSLWKFDVGNSTWNLTFEICLLKLDFGNFTFDLWCWTFQLDFWQRLTFEISLLKIDCCWNVTLKSWLLLGFAWVFRPLAEDAKTGNCNDQAKAIDLI